jgi:hypothetical protein
MMTSPEVLKQDNTAVEKQNDKEYNFRALESKYNKALEQERQARLAAEKRVQEALEAQSNNNDSDEPYVDHKKFERTLSSFEKKIEDKIDKRAEERAQHLYSQNKQQEWIKSNSDFFDVLGHADKLAAHDPELAETILAMPDNFERQKLVYKSIKSIGLHKPKEKTPSIQDQIDSNYRGTSYQPTNIGSGAFTQTADFSPAGQKQAYEKLQELKARLQL